MSIHPEHPYCKRPVDLENQNFRCRGWNRFGKHFYCKTTVPTPSQSCPIKNLVSGEYEAYCTPCYKNFCNSNGWNSILSICANKKAQLIDPNKTVENIIGGRFR